MIIQQDEMQLRNKSKNTSADECVKVDIFGKLEKALKSSKVSGGGLSAVQIGIPIRAGIIRMEHCDINFINPVIEKKKDLFIFKNEGCLSFPNVYVNTERYRSCIVRWLDESGKERKGSFEGLEAVVIQHEIDHLNGVLMFDRKSKPVLEPRKIGRNETCPCGSGKKYKKCCGR